MTDHDFVQTVSPLIGDAGFRYYFAAGTAAKAEELGLDAFSFYFLGRGGVLGDVEAPVVAAAFGYFNPDAVTMLWDGARAKVAPRDAGRMHLACCAEFGREHLGDIAGLDALCGALEKVNDGARRSAAGLPLYAGMATEPVPDDLPGRAMHLIAMLREHRGGVHLVAVVAAGLDPAVAHYARRPNDWELFGWSPDQAPTVTDIDRRRLAELDATTDHLLSPTYDVLDADGCRALTDGLHAAAAAIGDAGGLPKP